MILIDTYAWIEYFKGSQEGKIVEEYLDKKIITPSVVLVELSYKSVKEGWDFKKHLNFIKSKSFIMGLREDIIIKCGEIYVEQRKVNPSFGIMDAIILTTAKLEDYKILTGDRHFKGFKEAIMLNK